MNKTNFLFLLLILFVSSIIAQDTPPGGVSSGLQLWLDASDPDNDQNPANNPADNTDVTLWTDKSGNGNDVTTAGITQGGVNPPSYLNDQFNGQAALRFDETNNEALGSILVSEEIGDFTLFMVLEGEPASEEDFDAFFSSWNDPSNSSSFQIDYSQSLGNFQVRTTQGQVAFGPFNQELDLYTVRQEGLDLITYSDGVEQDQLTLTSAVGFNAYRVGVNRRADRFYDSKIAEVIIYNRSLTACELEQVTSYLGEKYGRDYYNLSANFGYESTFPNDITGIGAFPSACAGLNIINMGNSDILTINNPTSNDTPDEFLTFGHDGAGLGNSTDVPPAFFYRIDQVWRFDEDGNPGDVDITFDLGGIGVPADATAGDFGLLIDTDGSFADATISNAAATLDVINETITWTGVDLNEGDFVSLANGANVTWTGSVSDDWNVAGNWSSGEVPNSPDIVTIPTTPAGGNFPEVKAGTTATCADLTVASGATLTVNGELIMAAGSK